MSIDYIKPVDLSLVALNRVFSQTVDDLLAGLIRPVLGNTAEGPLPLILFSNCLGRDLMTVAHKMHGDAVRSQTVLVILVHPGLRA